MTGSDPVAHESSSEAESSPEAQGHPANRTYLALAALFGATLVLAIIWIVVTGLIARSHMRDADHHLVKLRAAVSAGDLSTAQRLSHLVVKEISDAQELTSGPAWWVAANLPAVGSPARTTRNAVDQAHRVSAKAPGLLVLAQDIAHAHAQGRGIDAATLARVTTALRAVTGTTRAATENVSDSSASWLPAVGNGRARLLHSLRKLDNELSEANRTVSILGPMIGTDRPQRYFIGFLNEAESRGLGGLPGAFAILTVDRGRFEFTHFGNDVDLKHVRTGVDLGPEYAARYAQDAPWDNYMNSDVSPDFRDAARIWAAMWQRKSGQRVDGALFMDPTALSYLLRATGPTSLRDGTRISAPNVVALTEKDQYAQYASDDVRNRRLNEISAAVSKKLVASVNRPLRIASALRHAIGQRRLGLWSADPGLEDQIARAGLGAVLKPSDAFTGFTVINAAGSKLDYYLDRHLSYARSDCSAGGIARATMRLTNDAPRSGLPAYVTTRLDDHPKNVRPGDNRVLVTYYASIGARIDSVSVNSHPVTVASGTEQGLTVVSIDLEMPVKQSQTIVVTVREPKPTGPLTVLKQPLVRGMTVATGSDRCN